jgi:hypothetical protein
MISFLSRAPAVFFVFMGCALARNSIQYRSMNQKYEETPAPTNQRILFPVDYKTGLPTPGSKFVLNSFQHLNTASSIQGHQNPISAHVETLTRLNVIDSSQEVGNLGSNSLVVIFSRT